MAAAGSSRLGQHSLVTSGNRKVYGTLLGCAGMLAAAQAGRVGEDGSGAMWIVPELVSRRPSITACTHTVQPAKRDIVFEVIRAQAGSNDVRLLRGASGAVVFEWNEATSELSFAAIPSTKIFDDVRVHDVEPPSLTRGAADHPIRSSGQVDSLSGRCGA
jgi:hypothetical protein